MPKAKPLPKLKLTALSRKDKPKPQEVNSSYKPKPPTKLPHPVICTPGQVKLLTGICKALKEEHGISLRQVYAAVNYLLDQERV